jgi:hypothetical protein
MWQSEPALLLVKLVAPHLPQLPALLMRPPTAQAGGLSGLYLWDDAKANIATSCVGYV